MPAFNFSSYYMNTALSDVGIRITLADGSPVQENLPGHGILLSNVSPQFKQEIEDKGTITLVVGQEPLQAEAAHALVQYVYQGALPDSTQQQALLVHMLHLAHQFAVESCRAACLQALMAVQQQDLQLDAIHVVFSLLSAQQASPGLPQLLQHCLDRLQQLLGDLEVTLSDQALLSHLQQLPHSALLALLHDERTAAASENSVLAAVQSWLAAQPHGAVDATQRQQLASAVRLPLLEPTYLATVLPRMQWLLSILGPQGLAAAAGAARGMFDPHAEPCLSNPRACGVAEAWLRGPRPLPASCNADQDRGPGVSIEWALPLAQVQQAFEAACGVAAAAAARRRLEAQAAAAAAAARSEGSEAAAAAALAAAGQQGWGASSAAAVSAAAAAAVSFGANMFRKRKHTEDQVDEAGTAAPDSNLHAIRHTAAGRDGGCQGQRTHKQRRCRSTQHVTMATPAAGAAVGAASGQVHQQQQQAVQQQGVQQPLKLYSKEQQFAGYTWRLVLYFQQAASSYAGQLDGAAAAAGAGGAVETHPARAAAIAVAAAYGSQHLQHHEAQGRRMAGLLDAAEAADGLGCQQTPGGSLRARRAAAQRQQQQALGLVLPLAAPRAAPLTPRQADVAAAAAMKLPGEASPAAPADARVGTAACVDADDDSSGLVWQARLALEAWPCVALQPGVSTVAFSGSLAVLGTLDGTGTGDLALHPDAAAAAAAGAAAAGVRPTPGGAAAGRAASSKRQPGGKLLAGAAGTSAAAAAACAPRSSSTALGDEGAIGRTPGGRRRAAAVAAAARIAAGGLTVPESDAEDAEDADDDVLLVEDDREAAAAAVAAAGVRVEGRAAAAAARGRAADGSSGSNGRGSEHTAAVSSDDEDAVDAAECGGVVDAAKPRRTPAAVRRASGGAADGSGALAGDASAEWWEFQLPQGSWVRSRRCDNGFRDFFGISLRQGHWEDEPWAKYVQPGGVLSLRGCIWNVR